MSVFLRVVAISFVVVLVGLLLGPGTPIERDIIGMDKLAHFGAFGLLLWSFGVLFRRQRRIVLALYAVGFGALTEVLQGLLGRDASGLDLVADGAGVASALFAWACWRRFKPRSALSGASQSPDKTAHSNA